MAEVILKEKLSKLFQEDALRMTYLSNEGEEVVLKDTELETAMRDVNGRLTTKLKTGVCSEFLKRQLALHQLQYYERFGEELHQFHYSTILDAIEANEIGKANTRPFDRNPKLVGYYHLHHNSSTYRERNILKHWHSMYKGKGGEIKYQNELLNEYYAELIKTNEPLVAKQLAIKTLISKIHMGSNFVKFQDQTGQWIVCKYDSDKWHYVCLATHSESDDSILARINKSLC